MPATPLYTVCKGKQCCDWRLILVESVVHIKMVVTTGLMVAVTVPSF